MVSEKFTQLKFCIKELSQFIEQQVLKLPITSQSNAFGGWSVLSSNGAYQDGWHQGHRRYRTDLNQDLVEEELFKKNVQSESNYILPTEICVGPMQRLIQQIQNLNLHPARARVIRLVAGGSTSWHQDAALGVYAVRLHIPIITNSGCFFEIQGEKEHLAADGSAYFLFVNRLHRVVNEGATDRFHLVMDVQDRNRITKYHQWFDLNPIESSKSK